MIKKLGLGLLAFFILGAIASAFEEDPQPDPLAAQLTETTTTAPPATPAPTTAPPTTQAPTNAEATTTAPSLTLSQQQAVRSAENYLAFTAFSREGLIDQLLYEEFSRENAEFAVDTITVDWMEQSAKSATNYLDFTAFSCGGLIEQLVFEGFSQAQAEHGANTTGIC